MELGGGRRGTVGFWRGELGKEQGLLLCFVDVAVGDWYEGRESKLDDDNDEWHGIGAMFP